MYPVIWIIKLVLAHMVTDFILQPAKWVKSRKQNHFASGHLYLHGFITALAAWLVIGWQYWGVAIIILVSHILIDGWKSYQKERAVYFLADQFLHLLVIFGCWCYFFSDRNTLLNWWNIVNLNVHFWIVVTAFVFLSFPASIMIGQLTKKWRDQLPDPGGLASAGKWIGIIERIIILTFILLNQYEAVGFLIAAKGLVRFNENNRPEIKTEYLLIGTLISIALALATGLAVKQLFIYTVNSISGI